MKRNGAAPMKCCRQLAGHSAAFMAGPCCGCACGRNPARTDALSAAVAAALQRSLAVPRLAPCDPLAMLADQQNLARQRSNEENAAAASAHQWGKAG